MRKALPAVLLVALVAGCGGGGQKKTLTPAQYVSALDTLCLSANKQVATLKLTTSIETWKKNGEHAAKIVKQTVKGFGALTRPDSLRAAAARYDSASEQIATAVQDAADAAQNGDTKKFDEALSRQANFGQKSNAAAAEIGAKACA